MPAGEIVPNVVVHVTETGTWLPYASAAVAEKCSRPPAFTATRAGATASATAAAGLTVTGCTTGGWPARVVPQRFEAHARMPTSSVGVPESRIAVASTSRSAPLSAVETLTGAQA